MLADRDVSVRTTVSINSCGRALRGIFFWQVTVMDSLLAWFMRKALPDALSILVNVSGYVNENPQVSLLYETSCIGNGVGVGWIDGRFADGATGEAKKRLPRFIPMRSAAKTANMLTRRYVFRCMYYTLDSRACPELRRVRGNDKLLLFSRVSQTL